MLCLVLCPKCDSVSAYTKGSIFLPFMSFFSSIPAIRHEAYHEPLNLAEWNQPPEHQSWVDVYRCLKTMVESKPSQDSALPRSPQEEVRRKKSSLRQELQNQLEKCQALSEPAAGESLSMPLSNDEKDLMAWGDNICYQIAMNYLHGTDREARELKLAYPIFLVRGMTVIAAKHGPQVQVTIESPLTYERMRDLVYCVWRVSQLTVQVIKDYNRIRQEIVTVLNVKKPENTHYNTLMWMHSKENNKSQRLLISQVMGKLSDELTRQTQLVEDCIKDWMSEVRHQSKMERGLLSHASRVNTQKRVAEGEDSVDSSGPRRSKRITSNKMRGERWEEEEEGVVSQESGHEGNYQVTDVQMDMVTPPKRKRLRQMVRGEKGWREGAPQVGFEEERTARERFVQMRQRNEREQLIKFLMDRGVTTEEIMSESLGYGNTPGYT